MRQQPLLGRLVVIGCYNQRRIRTDFLCELNEPYGLDRVVGPGTSDDRYATCGGFDHLGNHRFMLFMAERRAFAGRTNRYQSGRTLLNLPFDQVFERIQVQRAVAERGDQGWH